MMIAKNENLTDNIGTLKRKKNSNSILCNGISHDQWFDNSNNVTWIYDK